MPMLDTPISPADQLLADAGARLAAATAPPAPTPAQSPAPATPPADLLAHFERAADQFDVPVDALLGLADRDSNFDPTARSRGPGPKTRGLIRVDDAEMARGNINPYVPEQAIGAVAQKLRANMDRGMSLDQAIAEHGGGGAQGDQYLTDVKSRATRWADHFYPSQPAAAPVDPAAHNMDAPAAQGGLAQDAFFKTTGGLNKGLADLVHGVGQVGALIGDYTTTPILNRIFGREGKTPTPITDAAAKPFEKLKGRAETFVSEDTKKAVEDSSPGGDLFKPSTWTLGKNPSLRGYTAIGLDLFGGMLPILAASAATGGAAGGLTVGGLQGGGGAAIHACEAIEKMAQTPADPNDPKGPSKLAVESSYYKELLARGKTPEQALNITKLAAERYAFAFNAPISAVGGAVVGKALHPAAGKVGGTVAGRVLSAMGVPAAEMGVQNPVAAMAAKVGANVGAGTHEDVTEGTFGDFITGVASGLVPGAVGGARREAAIRAARGSMPPAAEVVREPEAAAPAPTPRADLSGPIGQALTSGAPHLTEAAQPAGRPVTITDEAGTHTGHIVGQDADGVMFRSSDGQDFLYSGDDIAKGKVRIDAGQPEPAPRADAPISAEPVAVVPVEAPRAEPPPRAGEDRARAAPDAAPDAARQPVARVEAGAQTMPADAAPRDASAPRREAMGAARPDMVREAAPAEADGQRTPEASRGHRRAQR